MEEEEKMPNTLGRRRLKDCITDRISRAVKKIYRCQYSGENGYVVLTNKDGQFHKLVEHLDHAFLHGLRNITSGYWVVVQDFTHKSTLTRIKHMTSVTTNLGRGRAWLYLALSDQLLESYLQCFIDNRKVVQRYYMKDAMMLDQQCMQILVSLAAGLEYITFQVDADVAYLDLATHIKSREMASTECGNDDSLSVCSLDSSLSQDSSVTADCPCHAVTSSYDSEDSMKTREDTSSLTASVCSLGEEGRIERISRLNSHHSDLNEVADDVEVIHVKTTRRKRPRKVAAVVGSVCTTPQSPESGYRSVMEKSGEDVESWRVTETLYEDLHHPVNGLSGLSPVVPSDEESSHPAAQLGTDIPPLDGDVAEAFDALEARQTDCADASSNQVISTDDDDVNDADIENSGSTDNHPSDVTTDRHAINEQNTVQDNISDIPDTNSKVSDSNSADSDCEVLSIYDNFPCDTATVGGSGVQHSSMDSLKCHTDSAKDNPDESTNTDSASNCSANCTDSNSAPIHKNDYRVDHNLMLLLMLHVFQQDDEHFIRMFCTNMGHMEGDIQPIFLLITSHALYILLHRRKRAAPFAKKAVVSYADLDYISLSLNYQLINVVCTNRRRQFWISTGDEQLSRCIVSFIDAAMRTDLQTVSHLGVLTDATTQRIALRKWIAQECAKQPSDITIICYLLVHWEVAASSRGDPLKGHREGKLQFRWCNSAQKSQNDWQTAYFVLRQGVLYRYNSQQDCVVQQALALNSEACHGCRRLPLVDKSHCFQIVLAGGSTMQMMASCDEDVQQWLQSVCEAVAMEPVEAASRLACCCVLANDGVFLCHEDTQTGFVRMLDFATVDNVTSMHVDPCLPTHCILTFASQNSTADECIHWILYFNAIPERDLFLRRLKRMWKAHCQMALPVSSISDPALLCRSQTGMAKISAACSFPESSNQTENS